MRVEPVERRVLLSAGQSDPTFGSGGQVAFGTSGSTLNPTSIVAEPNGDLIMAMGATVTRLTPIGATDPTFGSDGQVTVAGSFVTPYLLSDGDILLAYDSNDVATGAEQLTLEALTSTGAVDTSFGSGGTVVVPGTVGAPSVPGDSQPVAVGTGGSIYVLQSTTVTQYAADGNIDTAFGTDGTATLPSGPTLTPQSGAIAVDAQGRVVVSIGGAVGDEPLTGTGEGYVVERLTANGAVDGAFGTQGITAVTGANEAEADGTVVTIAPDGTIYAADNADEDQGDDRLAGIHAYSSAGQLEQTLAEPIGSGPEIIAYGGVTGMSVTPDGQLVVTGYYIPSEAISTGEPSEPFVARYDAVTGTGNGGALDASFDGTGVVTVSGSTGATAVGESVAIAPNGDILVAGSGVASAESDDFVDAYLGETSAVLTGTVTGTAGSYNNDGNTVADAFDGNLNTFFDGPTANGDVAGLDLGSPQVIRQIEYAPRSAYPARMVGGVFQGSNTSDFSSGVDTLYTVTAAPAAGR